MGKVSSRIKEKLAFFKIDLEKFMKFGSLKEKSTTLDGIEFIPVNLDGTKGCRDLIEKLINAEKSGKRAFAGELTGDTVKRVSEKLLNAEKLGERMYSAIDDVHNQPLNISFAATKGYGLREIWYPPPLLKRQYYDPLYNPIQFDSAFSQKFSGQSHFDISSLHCSLSDETCEIHIDNVGFIVGNDTMGVVVNPDACQHTMNELVLHTYIFGSIKKSKNVFVKEWIAPIVNNINFIYPSSQNLYSRAGPRLGQVLAASNRIPIVGHIPLPGLEVNIHLGKSTKLSGLLSNSIYNPKDYAFTLTLSGGF